MSLPTRARIAGILAIGLLMLGAPAAMALTPSYLPDAQIRPGWNPTYTGGGVINTDATDQAVTNTGVVGQKLTFFIKIVNVGASNDSLKVKRSSGFTNGYRVRYYDAVGTDVTGQVTVGSFTTPQLAQFGEYVMRATVKVRSVATACSSTSRLITVSSVNFPAAKDAVRFTAGLAPGCPDITVSPGILVATGQYAFNFGPAVGGESQMFTIKNEGTGASEELGFVVGGSTFGVGSGGTCGLAILPAGGACTFQVIVGCAGVNVTESLGVTGGAPPTTQYLTLYLTALCD